MASQRAQLAAWLILAALCVVHGRRLAQEPATIQGNETGLFAVEQNTCYRASIPLGSSTICSDPSCCYMACNDIWETSRCEYWCYCNSPDGCTLSGGDGSSMPQGTCLLSTNFNATAAARRRLRQADPADALVAAQLGALQSVQVTTGPAVPFTAGFLRQLAVIEPTLLFNGPLSPLSGSAKNRPVPPAVPADGTGDSRRRLLGVESFESRYYRGLEVLDRSNATSEEECNARCVNFTQCEYWAWCPTSQEEGCLLVEAVNSTATKTVPPGTCTLSWTPTEGSTDFLVMFGPAVTFFGGKWIPNDAALVTAAVALGQPGGTAQCLEFTGFGPGKGWQQGAYSEEHDADDADDEQEYDKDLATAICGGEPSANAAAFFTAVSSGGGKAALAAVLAAAQDDLPDCEDAADVLYAAAIDSFRLLQVAGNDTEAATAYAKEFIQGAKAAGVPACATVAVVDGAGVVLDSNKKHT